VIIKEKVIKAVCKGAAAMLPVPYPGDRGIVLEIGASSAKRYCAVYGGTVTGDPAQAYRRKDAPAPEACPAAEW
jgi:hypothetical protein